VDNGLDSALALHSLGQDFGEVDADRVTLMTMPWQGDTDESDSGYQSRVEASPGADAIFADIKNDKSFTTSDDSASATSSASGSAADAASSSPPASGAASGSASGSASASESGGSTGASTDPSASVAAEASEEQAARTHPMHVDVINASGTTQRYETVVSRVFQDGFVYSAGSDAAATEPTTTLVYAAEESAAAEELAGDLGLPASALQATGTGSTLTLTIGTDWTSGATYSAAGSSYSASAAISVPDDSYEENGANTGACVTANPDYETGSSGDSSQ
jgi:hypothetical protein